jgi:hypothetical protein
MPYTKTVPAASNENDHKDWHMQTGKYSQRVDNSRTNTIIGVCLAALLSLMTIALCWLTSTVVSYGQDLVGVKKDIQVLVSRPDGVSRLEYNRDMIRLDAEIEQMVREQRERKHGG